MCGIIGILGKHEAAPIMVEALRRLEYRGYDSAGIATIHDNRIERRRAVGKLNNLADLLVHDPVKGKSGIGHTRWATHGAPNEKNAHPHKAGPVAVVHNGIIENFKELREGLLSEGVSFESDTDTECIAQLCVQHLEKTKDPIKAAKRTIAELEGAYALAFLFEGENDLMVAARAGSPLAIGQGDHEIFVGSDAIALSPLTDKIMYLEEGDIAVLNRNAVQVFDKTDTEVLREFEKISANQGLASKGNYKHFMEKEIAEQPRVISDLIRHYVKDSFDTPALDKIDVDFRAVERVVMVACGTAYLSCATAKYWFEEIARLPVEVDIASEFRYRAPVVNEKTLTMFISQSGETADTLAALRYCKENGAKTLAIVNVETSTIAREADAMLPILAGVEIGVASTKAFTCQLSVLYFLALEAAHQRGSLNSDGIALALRDFARLSGIMHDFLAAEGNIIAASKRLEHAQSVLFLGRGQMHPLALEGALKLKETSYIHAEGYASGELKHGPIALVDEKLPVVVFAPKDALFEKTVSNMQEVKARGGQILLFTNSEGAKLAGNDADLTIELPDVPDHLAAIAYAIPAQLFAYHTAVLKGTDVDQPRNLAKSVTVE